jgi:hypothetical protein
MAHLLFFGVLFLEVLGKELFGHGTPYLSTLHIGDEATFHQVKPVGLIKLWPDKEI